jgi:hypothetical protein
MACIILLQFLEFFFDELQGLASAQTQSAVVEAAIIQKLLVKKLRIIRRFVRRWFPAHGGPECVCNVPPTPLATGAAMHFGVIVGISRLGVIVDGTIRAPAVSFEVMASCHAERTSRVIT